MTSPINLQTDSMHSGLILLTNEAGDQELKLPPDCSVVELKKGDVILLRIPSDMDVTDDQKKALASQLGEFGQSVGVTIACIPEELDISVFRPSQDRPKIIIPR